MRGSILLAAGLLAATGASAQPPALTMTCHPIYQGNDLGPQVYRVEGVELIKTDPARSEPIILSSAVKRQALDRVNDGGKIIYTSASHRLRGPILTRTIFWADATGKVTKSFTETYDFRAKTITGLTKAVDRCR